MNLEQFSGVNAGYVLELYEKYRRDPESVDPATRQAFESWQPPATSEASVTPGPGGPAGELGDVRLQRRDGRSNLLEEVVDLVLVVAAELVGEVDLFDELRRHVHLRDASHHPEPARGARGIRYDNAPSLMRRRSSAETSMSAGVIR